MTIKIADCCLVITSTNEPKCTVTVTLTSPACRDEDDEENQDESEKKEIVKPGIFIKRTLSAYSLYCYYYVLSSNQSFFHTF